MPSSAFNCWVVTEYLLNGITFKSYFYHLETNARDKLDSAFVGNVVFRIMQQARVTQPAINLTDFVA